MNLSGHTVLVTGGASGIGLAIAVRFLRAGSRVVVCGRRQSKLDEAAARYPELITRVADVASAAGRRELIDWMCREHPDFDVLVNNAGIQRRRRFATDDADWNERAAEIAINFEAPAHLCSLVLEPFKARSAPAIVNVSSGLAFVPAIFAPVYAATKAAIHSLSMSLRAEFAPLGIDVIEIAPPAVNTDLGGVGIHTDGAPVDDFADAVMARVAAGEVEVGYESSEAGRRASRDDIDARFAAMVDAYR